MRHTLVLLLWPLAGCIGGDDSGDSADGVDIDPAVIIRLADRVAATQNDDGSWDWERGVDEALTPEETGYQNVTGVTAFGLYGALNHASDEDWLVALDQTGAYFDARLDGLIADPTDTEASIASANWTFLAELQDVRPDADLDAKSIEGLNALLDARDEVWGDDDTRRIDGLLNYMAYYRSYIPGILPWDGAHWLEGLDAMAGRSDDFAADAADMRDWLADYSEDTFLPAYDADPTLIYGDISLAWPLYVLDGGAGADPDLLDGLQTRLEDLVDDEGKVSNGSDDDGPVQCSAYALLALKRRGSSLAQRVQDYGEASVDGDGIVWNPDRAVENYEIEGELLRALSE